MALFLIELSGSGDGQPAIAALLDRVAAQAGQIGGELIEAKVTADGERAYAVVEHEDEAVLRHALAQAGLPVLDVAQVRLVGATIDEVKASRGAAQYLVEWDLPADLTMETYLARKREKAPLYAKVPEVRFLRTYVREDMVKCLCLYDAPDEDAVRRAREAVSTPIDRLYRLEDTARVTS